MKLSRILFSLLLLIFSLHAGACTIKWSGRVINLNYSADVIVQRDTPDGTVVSSQMAYINRTDTYADCAAGENSSQNFTLSNGWFPVNDLSATNIPGIAIRIGWDFGGGLWGYLPMSRSMNTSTAYTWNLGSLAGWRVDLIKIGPVVGGRVKSGKYASWTIQGTEIASLNSNGANIVPVACSLDTQALTFPMGNIQASAFGTTIGTIPAGGQNTQNLGLNCDPKANINVSLSGTQNPDTANTSVLALSNMQSPDTAQGVGVQFLYNGYVWSLNNRIVLKQSAGGQETFPITARYYQTKTKVTAGSANMSATLNITYQ